MRTPVLPAYGLGCIDSVVASALEASRVRPVVVLVVDGLGWVQLQVRRDLAPVMAGLAGGPITSVAPTTTAAAMTSITTGLPPGAHGVVGYRVRVPLPERPGGEGVLNVLRWRVGGEDARTVVDPAGLQPHPAFRGQPVPAVTRAEFARTGFSAAHLAGARLVGWRMPSTLVVEVGRLLAEGERFVFAYYDGVDKVAHEYGLGPQYEAEVAAVDRLVGDLLAVLPEHAALVITSDHGQVDVGDSVVTLDPELVASTTLLSGEARFRWLHTEDPGGVAARARRLYGEVAWIATRKELIDAGWFGPVVTPEAEARLGDVALVPFEPIGFLDPADTGETRLVARHGSLTAAEMLVPLLVGTR